MNKRGAKGSTKKRPMLPPTRSEQSRMTVQETESKRLMPVSKKKAPVLGV